MFSSNYKTLAYNIRKLALQCWHVDTTIGGILQWVPLSMKNYWM